MPYHCKSDNKTKASNIDTHGSILRQYDVFILNFFLTFFIIFHHPKCIMIGYLWYDCEIIERYRRRHRPFKSSTIPWITGDIPILFSIFNAYNELRNLEYSTKSNNANTNNCDNE